VTPEERFAANLRRQRLAKGLSQERNTAEAASSDRDCGEMWTCQGGAGLRARPPELINRSVDPEDEPWRRLEVTSPSPGGLGVRPMRKLVPLAALIGALVAALSRQRARRF
jgi:hypothetical protein